jgi:hypothetical protein
VTHLRQIMFEELHRCNYVESTIRTYIRTAELNIRWTSASKISPFP